MWGGGYGKGLGGKGSDSKGVGVERGVIVRVWGWKGGR